MGAFLSPWCSSAVSLCGASGAGKPPPPRPGDGAPEDPEMGREPGVVHCPPSDGFGLVLADWAGSTKDSRLL